MLDVLPEPRPELKPHVPRMVTLFIPVDRIGAVIGPGGRVIRALQEETDTKIDIMEDGRVFIAAVDQKGAQEAVRRIEALTELPEEGRIYTGRVVRITDFGAIVEILPNASGMVHISQLAPGRVEKVEDVVNVGDEIQVMVTKIDPSSGKIRLSRQAVLEGWTLEEAQANDRGIRGRGSRPGRGGRGGDRRGGSSRRGGSRREGDRDRRGGGRPPRRNG